ncbi:hypothetical protein F4778DRAFT_244974 [Xylariomycetidae sp. FL2044]|nr:hypothetical protein F4778DRAFT_244974 [Xylariomycetidae sp. FL2044]
MCINIHSTYPCGHTKTRWELCQKAKVLNAVRVGQPNTPCGTIRGTKQEEPDLEDTCGSTCLTRPFQCSQCEHGKKEVGWRCSKCSSMRDSSCLLWDVCRCHNPKQHDSCCGRMALGRGTESAICDPCLQGCVIGVKRLSWKCHGCGWLNRTPGAAMVCGNEGGCAHRRCGKCSALFNCTCECGCAFHFVEGGSRRCDRCLKTCAKK